MPNRICCATCLQPVCICARGAFMATAIRERTTGPVPPRPKGLGKADHAFDVVSSATKVAEAIVAVKGEFKPEDLEPRFVEPPPAITAPVVTDSKAALDEMGRFDTTPGKMTGPERCDPKPLTFNAAHLVGSFYHVLECPGDCGVPFGCAPQWQAGEVLREALDDHDPAGSFRRDLRHKTSAERKAEPIHSAIMKYHPDAMAAHARLCVAGNIKHNGPDAPLDWSRDKSGDHLDCAARHMLTPDAVDPETGETELTAAFWRLGCALQLQQERLLAEKGIMPYSGVTPPK
jgi:hypothetical protein